MAIRIELWTDGHLAGGTEAWWDGMEAALQADTGTAYPLLDRVDPYGNVVFVGDELRDLASELRVLLLHAHEGVRGLANTLMDLCRVGIAASEAKLKFLGD